jgi:hypothetical protein
LNVQFTAIWEYDPTEDPQTILGYPFEGEIEKQYIGYYKYTPNGWQRMRGKRWRQVRTPVSFAHIPKVEKVAFRKPSANKIRNLNIEQALNYIRASEGGQDYLIRYVQGSLLDYFYPETKEMK